jgi:hypothetical protein
MERSAENQIVQVRGAEDGAVTYFVGLPPEALPAVRARDLAAAWDAARAAAIGEAWGQTRLFRFRRADGSFTDLALTDRDACCWARAVDATADMSRPYGLALCLRLLALVDLLGRAPWAAGLFQLKRDGAALHPEALRAPATAPLTAQGRFDDITLRERLRPLTLAAPFPSPGARA